MNKKNRLIKFITFTVVIFAIISLWQINTGQTWESQGKIIILGKGIAEKNNINQITENILYFPYDIQNIELERIGKSGIIEITSFAKDKQNSAYSLEESFKSIFSTISQLYNIKTEIEVKIIERNEAGSNYMEVLQKDFFKKILFSFIISIIIIILIERFKKQKKTTPAEFKRPRLKLDKKKPDFTKSNRSQPKTVENKPKASSKTSFAPTNLPLAGDEIEKMFGAVKNGRGYKTSNSTEEIANKDTLIKNDDESLIKEATPEEVKERLNKLLGGI